MYKKYSLTDLMLKMNCDIYSNVVLKIGEILNRNRNLISLHLNPTNIFSVGHVFEVIKTIWYYPINKQDNNLKNTLQ